MSFSDRDGVIWFNGEMVPWREANIHVLTHTLHYGMGVFEGLRVYETAVGPAIFRLHDHTDRLYNSAKVLNITIPYSKTMLNEAQKAVVLANKLTASYIRPLVFYGDDTMGLNVQPSHRVNVVIAAWEWGAYLGATGLEAGIRVKTSSYSRHHVNSMMCKAKATGNYVNSILARQEAARDGYDEALMLDTQGFVAEGSGENVFIVRNNTLHTPAPTSCLNGITRDTIITLAKMHGYTVIERNITRDEVVMADEVFFTGTAAEVTPVVSVDGHAIGAGKRGPMTHLLQTRFFDQVCGRSEQNKQWLTVLASEEQGDTFSDDEPKSATA